MSRTAVEVVALGCAQFTQGSARSGGNVSGCECMFTAAVLLVRGMGVYVHVRCRSQLACV